MRVRPLRDLGAAMVRAMNKSAYRHVALRFPDTVEPPAGWLIPELEARWPEIRRCWAEPEGPYELWIRARGRELRLRHPGRSDGTGCVDDALRATPLPAKLRHAVDVPVQVGYSPAAAR